MSDFYVTEMGVLGHNNTILYYTFSCDEYEHGVYTVKVTKEFCS